MTKKKAALIISAVAVGVLVVAVMALFIPRTGEKRSDVWSVNDEFDVSAVASLEKKAGEDFNVMLFTDLQLWMDLTANKTVYDMMDSLVEEGKPDLIVLMGDNVSGIATDTLTKRLIRQMESYGIPWAPVFGNHDGEGNATLEWQADLFEEAEHCLFRRGPSNLSGIGNYVINVTENGEIVESLYLLDSGRYREYDGIGEREDYIGYDQIAWYEWNVRGIEAAAGRSVPSMVFAHYALPEFRTAVETLCEKRGDKYYVPEALGSGFCYGLPGASPVNSGFFDKAKELGSTTHVFAGHDHENNAVIDYEGITLAYGLKTGCSPKPWNNAEYYGATVVTIGDGVTLHNIERAK